MKRLRRSLGSLGLAVALVAGAGALMATPEVARTDAAPQQHLEGFQACEPDCDPRNDVCC